MPVAPRPLIPVAPELLARIRGEPPWRRATHWAFEWSSPETREALVADHLERRSVEVHADLGLYGEHLAIVEGTRGLGVGVIAPDSRDLGRLARRREAHQFRIAVIGDPRSTTCHSLSSAYPAPGVPIPTAPWDPPESGPTAVLRARLRDTTRPPLAEAVQYLRVHLPPLQDLRELEEIIVRSSTLGPFGGDRAARVCMGVGQLAATPAPPGARRDLVCWELGVRLAEESDASARRWLSRLHRRLQSALRAA